MAEFLPAVNELLKHEGGFVDDPVDPGGATNFGVSLRWLQSMGDIDGDGLLDGDLDGDGDVDADDIRHLGQEEAIHFYKTQWWDRYRYDAIQDTELATMLLSLSVHAGPRAAHKILQKAILYFAPVRIDGIIGPLTRASANSVEPDRLKTEFRHETAAFYRLLVRKNSKLTKYLKGWINRAYA